MNSWIDITRPIDETLVLWPGRARPRHRWEQRIAEGAHCNASFWELSAHSGTHMDAPMHFVQHGKSIDEISPDVFIGECQVINLGSMPMDEQTANRYAGTKRLLVRTTHSVLHADARYEQHEALITEQAASVLLGSGLLLIGTDRLSVDDSRGQEFRLHNILLGASCVIVEGLLLADVNEGSYLLSAVPLRFTKTEASPVRALLKETASCVGSPIGM